MFKQVIKFLPFIIALSIVPFLLPGGRLGAYYLTLMILSGSYAIAALGLTVLLGYAGQVSLGQAAFFGIGSYSFSILAVNYHLNFWIAFLLGVVISILFGVLLGGIVLRLKTHYLALVTIGFQIITNLVLNNWEFTGGADGISNIPRPIIFGLSFLSDRNFYWLILAFIALAAYVVYRLRYSLMGGTLLALREDEIAASTNGISIVWSKILAFSVCAGLAGVGGILYASGSMYISPNVYTFSQSVTFFAMVLVGGQESIVGTVLGAALLTFLPEELRFLQAYYIAVYGLLVVVVILFMPEGIYGIITRAFRSLIEKFYGQQLAPKEGEFATGRYPSVEMGASVGAEEVLGVKGLHKYFGGVKAVQDVSFSVRKGDVAVLIGPNGSGKTTVLNVVSGIYDTTSGQIIFRNKNIANWQPHKINRIGLSRTFQNIRLFPELTALENVVIGYYPKSTVGLIGTLLLSPLAFKEQQAAIKKAKEKLRLLGFERFHEKAKNLPYGEQRIVEIARAIICDPQLLLLDEPAAGMNREEKLELSSILKRIRSMGITILLIEHDMSFVSDVSTKVYVMDFGGLISEGSASEVLADPEVVKAYLGEETDYATS